MPNVSLLFLSFNGSIDYVHQNNEYTYDKNGNMTQDLNKRISSIQYNLLNLPQNITYSTGSTIAYTYDASGKKLHVAYGSPNSTTDYCSNMIYENGTLTKILVDGGYITFSGTAPVYHYYLKDHQGNNRVVMSSSGTVEQVNHYFPYGYLFGESTNSGTQKYKYNDKEFDMTHGLHWYDYGARHYDPCIMRFTTMDPMCEKYYNLSPYAYCGNNPVNAVDPDGKNPIYDTQGNFLGTDDLGLQGAYYVMDKNSFSQGMSHAKVGDYAVFGKLDSDVEGKINAHYNNLPNRPDYDGFVSVREGIEWAKSHPYALQNPSPDNTLYIDTSQLDFGNLSTSDFPVVGKIKPQNLFKDKNIIESVGNPVLLATVYALGRVDMILNNREQGTVSIVNNNATDYDWNVGGGLTRDFFIRANNAIFGINPQIHGFKAYYYGMGRLRK